MKILRLSLFNLKKNKREVFSVIFLTAIAMLLMGVAVSNMAKVNTFFDKSFEETGSVSNIVRFSAEKYRQDYRGILEDDSKVSGVEEIDLLNSVRGSYKYGDQEIGVPIFFVTEDSEKKIENFVPETALTEAEISNFSHPIWMPNYFHYSRNYQPGDTFIYVIGGREYPFEIAGFYNSGLMGNTSNGLKCIVSEADYQLLSAVMDKEKGLAFNCEESFSVDKYLELCADQSSENVSKYCMSINKKQEKDNATIFIKLYLSFLLAVAFITMVSCLFMIRHKISNDIEDQMQAIGVLEALGYKSREISLAYIFEYVLTGGIGALLGILLVIFTDPFLNSIIEGMIGYSVYGSVNIGLQLLIMCILVLVIVLSALGKAKTVKKYPPVVAFRKGINTHHFRKNFLPLSKTKGNINLRLSMKELLGNTKHSIGIMVCIFATATVIIFGFHFFDFLKDGAESIMTITGLEAGDVRLELRNGVDPYKIKETMLELPEVRKVLVTYTDTMIDAKSKNPDHRIDNSLAVIFDNFDETENLHLIEGRYPQHDNEIMVAYGIVQKEGYSLGDSIKVIGDGTEISYIITGVVNSMNNGGKQLYFTSDGFKRAFPSDRPSVVEIYLNENIDRHKFSEKLTGLYGGSVEDAIGENISEDNYEDRIQRVAEEKMAQLISLYGVTDVDYSIKIGDDIISRNSEKFIIRDISSLHDLAEGQLGPVAVAMKAVSAVIVAFSLIVSAVILSSIAGTTVRRKRKELGIMKAMGYTSKNLMQQIAFRIMPITFIAVIIASVCSVLLVNLFGLTMFSVILEINYWIMIPIDICILLFCYLVTYISASKIKEISVTELMSE